MLLHRHQAVCSASTKILPCHLARTSRHVRQSILCNIPRPLHKTAAHQCVMVSALPMSQGKVLIDATNPLSPFPALEVRWGGKSGETLTVRSSLASCQTGVGAA